MTKRIKYITNSNYLSEIEIWLRSNEVVIRAGKEVSTIVEPQVGFVRQKTYFEVTLNEQDSFESDWRYTQKTFPSRLRVLATAIRNCELYGKYFSTHCAGKIELRRIEQSSQRELFPILPKPVKRLDEQ